MKNQSHNENEHKLFNEAWKLLHSNIRMFHYWFKNGDLSIQERRLLKCFYYYKKNKKSECIELLEAKINDDTYLEGIRLYLKGLVYNQYCHYTYAIANLEKAIDHFKSINELRFQLNSLFLIVMVYGNRRDLHKMAMRLDEVKEFELETNIQKIQCLYAELFYFVLTNNKDAVLTTCKKAIKYNYFEYKEFHPYFLVQKFMFFAKNKEYKSCYKILQEYKKISGNVVKANYSYMKTLLDHLDKNSQLYIYARDYEEFPELYEQLEVIKNLKDGNLERAGKFWKKLATHNPSLYGKNFEFKGDYTLFAQGLELYLKHNQQVNINQEEIDKLTSPLKKLIFILTSSPRPVELSDLIKMIWKEDHSEATIARLRKLASRYNQKSNVKILASMGTYKLNNNEKEIA